MGLPIREYAATHSPSSRGGNDELSSSGGLEAYHERGLEVL